MFFDFSNTHEIYELMKILECAKNYFDIRIVESENGYRVFINKTEEFKGHDKH